MFLYKTSSTKNTSFTVSMRTHIKSMFMYGANMIWNWSWSCSFFQWRYHWGHKMWDKVKQCGPEFAWRGPKRHGQMYSEISVDYLTKLPASAQVILLIICQVSEVRLFQSNSQSTPQSPTLWLQILRL